MSLNVSSSDTQKAAIDRRKQASDRISEMCRYIGFGLLALALTLMSSTSGPITSLYARSKSEVLAMATTGTLTILLEYLNTLCIFVAAELAMKDKEHNYLYKENSWTMKLSYVFFVSKQIMAGLGSIIVLQIFINQ